MRNVCLLLALMAIAVAGVQGACVNQNCWHTRVGRWSITNGQLTRHDGYIYLWGDDSVIDPSNLWEASICVQMRSDNPDNAQQHCYDFEDHDVEQWRLDKVFNDTCPILLNQYQVVTGGEPLGTLPEDDVQYCECYNYE